MRRPGEIAVSLPGGKAGVRLREFKTERGLTGPPAPPADQAWTDYAKAIEMKVAQRALLDPKTQPRWSPIGPFSIPHGQTYGAAQAAVSGRISCIAIDPLAPAHILVGSGGGGIWQTKNDGVLWTEAEAAQGEAPIAIGAIAFVPGQSKIVYAGTGEGNSLAMYGVGLWKSEDGGTTWSAFATDPFVGLGFYAIVIDPLDPQHMLAATTGGLFQITKDDPTWKLVLPITDKTGLINGRAPCWDVSMHPQVADDAKSTQEVFAATFDGLFRSGDGGSTWTQISLWNAPNSFERLAVCHARSNGDVVYASSKDQGGNPALWRRIDANGAFFQLFCPPGINTKQIDYDWFVAASPSDPYVVYLGAVSLWRGMQPDGITWQWANIASRKYGDNNSIHTDQHTIAFGDGGAIYVGNDGGIFKSADDTKTWQPLNQGLCIAQLEYIAQHPDYDAWLLGGTQDNGTLRYEGGEVWHQVAVGDGGEVATNNLSPYTVYHCFTYTTLSRSLTGGDTASWVDQNLNAPADSQSLFYSPMEVLGNLVVQAGSYVFVSTDTGTTFLTLDLPQDAGRATALWLASPFQFVVGTEIGDLHRFDWSGNGWSEPMTLAQPRAGYISSVRGDVNRPERLWVTYSDTPGPTVYRGDKQSEGDYKWFACTDSGLPEIAANVLEIDPSVATDSVYVGTDAGVWRGQDAGGKCQWTLFSNGLPNAIVGDLAFFHTKEGARILRAATRSRGVWELDFSKEAARDVQIYLRHSAVDTGRRYPSLQGVPNPFVAGAVASWWQSTDVLIDSAPYSIVPEHVSFVVFEEARRADPKTAYGTTNVYVQVHQRGPVGAANVVVRVYAAATVGNLAPPGSIPDLPAGFWANQDQPPAGSVWSLVGQRSSVQDLKTGQPKVAAFQWSVAKKAKGYFWLLATVTADNDKLDTAELSARKLVQNEAKCALKLVWVDGAG